MIPVRHQMYLLHQAIDGLVERGALNKLDREIVRITENLVPDWFTS